jgi:hypothetical protein
MPFHEVLPKQVGTTPCEFTAVNTQSSPVLLALVSRESLRLCIIKIANAARVPASADSRLLSWSQSLLEPVGPLRYSSFFILHNSLPTRNDREG